MLGVIITIKKYAKQEECKIQECGVYNLKLVNEVLTDKEEVQL